MSATLEIESHTVPGHEIRLELLSCRPARGSGLPARGRPILFLHGAFSGAWVWAEHFLPWFAERGREAWALSLRGHGNSDGRLSEAGIEDFADDLDAAIQRFPAPPILVAHSMGGFVAMRWLERVQSEAAALVLMASVPHTGLNGPASSMALFQPILMGEIALMQMGGTGLVGPDTLKRALFSEDVDPARLGRFTTLVRPESMAATLEMQMGQPIDTGLLMRKLPILVMGAEHDQLVPRAFVRSTARALGESAVILPGVGHAMMLDHYWQRPARTLDAWLSDHQL